MENEMLLQECDAKCTFCFVPGVCQKNANAIVFVKDIKKKYLVSNTLRTITRAKLYAFNVSSVWAKYWVTCFT